MKFVVSVSKRELFQDVKCVIICYYILKCFSSTMKAREYHKGLLLKLGQRKHSLGHWFPYSGVEDDYWGYARKMCKDNLYLSHDLMYAVQLIQ